MDRLPGNNVLSVATERNLAEINLLVYSFMEWRKKISIRLVLGASVNSIFDLLITHFLKLVLISSVIAMRIA